MDYRDKTVEQLRELIGYELDSIKETVADETLSNENAKYFVGQKERRLLYLTAELSRRGARQ